MGLGGELRFDDSGEWIAIRRLGNYSDAASAIRKRKEA